MVSWSELPEWLVGTSPNGGVVGMSARRMVDAVSDGVNVLIVFCLPAWRMVDADLRMGSMVAFSMPT